MGRMYTVVFSAVSLSAAQDLFEISPADDKPCKIKGISLAQTGVADVGDAQEEMLKLDVIRGHTTSGSGGGSYTPGPLNPSDTAAGFAAEINNTTIAASGTTKTLHSSAWNVRGTYDFWWPDETEPTATQANTTMVVRMATAPADAITVSGTLYVIEEG